MIESPWRQYTGWWGSYHDTWANLRTAKKHGAAGLWLAI